MNKAPTDVSKGGEEPGPTPPACPKLRARRRSCWQPVSQRQSAGVGTPPNGANRATSGMGEDISSRGARLRRIAGQPADEIRAAQGILAAAMRVDCRRRRFLTCQTSRIVICTSSVSQQRRIFVRCRFNPGASGRIFCWIWRPTQRVAAAKALLLAAPTNLEPRILHSLKPSSLGTTKTQPQFQRTGLALVVQAKAVLKELCESNQRLVVSIAKRFQNRGVDFDDLVQGNLGLMKGIQRFDPDKGAALSTYLTQTILNALACAVAQQGHVICFPQHILEIAPKVAEIIKKAADEGRNNAKCQTNCVPPWSDRSYDFRRGYQQNRHYLCKSRSTTFPMRPWKT